MRVCVGLCVCLNHWTTTAGYDDTIRYDTMPGSTVFVDDVLVVIFNAGGVTVLLRLTSVRVRHHYISKSSDAPINCASSQGVSKEATS